VKLEWVRRYCLSLPHASEQVLWEIDLVFKVGGKMFAILVLEPRNVCLTFKCTPEDFAELIECPEIIPAPYSARSHWVGLESPDALSRPEILRLIRRSYDLVFAKLTKKLQREWA
jgi:predicted DNA-binding protein (MmcQ/YjbR family)